MVVVGDRVKYSLGRFEMEGTGRVQKVMEDGRCFVKDDETIMVVLTNVRSVEVIE